jgi:hypothetical protein
MIDTQGNMDWSRRQMEQQHSRKNDNGDVIEDLGGEGKLDQGFSTVDDLEEVDIGNGDTPMTTFISASMSQEHKDQVRHLIREFSDCFAWSYTKMPMLSRDLVEHRIPIKKGFS